MSKIPTARTIATSKIEADRMVKFAKLHVKAALEAGFDNNFHGIKYEDYIKAYPLTNIK